MSRCDGRLTRPVSPLATHRPVSSPKKPIVRGKEIERGFPRSIRSVPVDRETNYFFLAAARRLRFAGAFLAGAFLAAAFFGAAFFFAALRLAGAFLAAFFFAAMGYPFLMFTAVLCEPDLSARHALPG